MGDNLSVSARRAALRKTLAKTPLRSLSLRSVSSAGTAIKGARRAAIRNKLNAVAPIKVITTGKSRRRFSGFCGRGQKCFSEGCPPCRDNVFILLTL